jgi:hypothetical protein
MIRQDSHRIDPKRRAVLDHKKKQFAAPSYKQQDYPHRLNFYDVPPTAEITLEEFEQWAIDRLKGRPLVFVFFSSDKDSVSQSQSPQCSPKSKPVRTETSLPRKQRLMSSLC